MMKLIIAYIESKYDITCNTYTKDEISRYRADIARHLGFQVTRKEVITALQCIIYKKNKIRII